MRPHRTQNDNFIKPDVTTTFWPLDIKKNSPNIEMFLCEDTSSMRLETVQRAISQTNHSQKMLYFVLVLFSRSVWL